MFIVKKVVNMQPLSYRELFVRCYLIMPRSKYALKTLSSSCRFPNIVRLIPNKIFYLNGNLYPWSNIFTKRYMATKKAKSKKKGSVVRTSGKLDLSLADGILDLKPVEKNMETCVNKFTDEMKHRLTLKLTDAAIDNIQVTIESQKSLLYEVASVSSNTEEFIIRPMLHGANVVKEIVLALRENDMNLNPRIENDVIKVPVPLGSSERRDSLMKQSKSSAENAKTIIRKIRQQTLKQLNKAKTSKDNERLVENQIELLTERFMKKIEETLAQKEKELRL